MPGRGLKELVPLPRTLADNGWVPVDIVFVHGLNGDRELTWTKGSVTWPLHLLPSRIPNARIMTFGYNADIALNYSTYGIKDHATKLLTDLRDRREEQDEVQRPLIFVAHSLGGIIVKQALLVASIDRTYSDIAASTQGIVFMGTPHRGSNIATWGRLLAGIAKAAFLSPKTELLNDLKANSKSLNTLSEDFIKITSKYKIKSFYEEDKTKGFVAVVEKDSAIMNCSEEEPIPIEGNHHSICKFSGEDDERFGAVWRAIRRLIPRLETQQLSVEQVGILERLPGPTPEECLESVEEPFLDSFDWVAVHPEFTRWITSTESHVLHISGPPGSGKSVLASFLYQRGLESVCKHKPFLFCFQNRNDRCTTIAAWSALVSQFLNHDPSLFDHIHLLARPDNATPMQRFRDPRSWKEPRLKQVFERVAINVRHPSIYIIDALDECDKTLWKFLESLSALIKQKRRATIKFLLLSRPQYAKVVKSNFSNTISIELDEESSHNENIKRFISSKVEELCRDREGLQPLCSEIIDSLSRTSMGMYLLPTVVIDHLKTVRATKAGIRKAIDRLPDNMLVAYRRALDDVPPEHRPMTSRMLIWVVFAVRPLTTEELASASALEMDTNTSDELKDNTSLDVLGDPGVVQLLGTLLKVRAAAKPQTGSQQQVCLIHSSAREFLLKSDQLPDDSNLATPPVWLLNYFYGGPMSHLEHSFPGAKSLWSNAHRNLAENILQYLQICLGHSRKTIARNKSSITTMTRRSSSDAEDDSFRSERFGINADNSTTRGADSSRDLSTLLSSFPTLRYCYENLSEHVREVDSTDDSFHYGFAQYLSSSEGADWIRTFWSVKDPWQTYGEQPPLHFASALALLPTIRSLLSLGHNPRSTDSYGTTLLDVATSTGLVDVISLLYTAAQRSLSRMKYGAPKDYEQREISTRGFKNGNILHTAAWHGYQDATRYLLSAGVDPCAHDNSKRTPLDIAVEFSNKNLVQVFLDSSSQSDIVVSAIRGGRLQTIKWLVEQHGIDLVDKKWGGNTSIYEEAAKHNKLDCIEYLREIGYLTDSQDLKETFHVAAANGSPSVVRFFLENSLVNIDAIDGRGRSALHHACLNRQGYVAQILVLAGVNMNLTDTDGCGAFECLISSGGRSSYMPRTRTGTLQIFQDPSSRKARMTHGGNAIHLALREKDEQDVEYVLETLLSWGLDPCEKDDTGSTALFLAASWRDWRLDRLLTICDCANVPNLQGSTPLHELLTLPGGEVPDFTQQLSALLKSGASLETQDAHGMTGLHLAATHPHRRKEIDRLLKDDIEHCVNKLDNQGRTPLHYFLASRNDFDSNWTWPPPRRLDMFLRNGADVGVRDNLNKTPLDLFVQTVAKLGKNLPWNSISSFEGIVARLVDHGADLEAIPRQIKEEVLRKLAETKSSEHAWMLRLSLESQDIVTPELWKDISLSSKIGLLDALAATHCPDDDILNLIERMSTEETEKTITFHLYGRACAWRLASLFARLLESVDPMYQLNNVSPNQRDIDAVRKTITTLGPESVIGTKLASLSALFCTRLGDLWSLQRCLKDLGADVNTVDPTGKSLLCIASELGDTATMAFLLRNKASLEKEDVFQRTALYWAARQGSMSAVKMLVDHGAKLTTYAVDVGDLYSHEDISTFLRGLGNSSMTSIPS